MSSASICSCARAGLGVLGGRNCDFPAAPELGEFRSALRDCRAAGERESGGKLMSSYNRPKYESLEGWKEMHLETLGIPVLDLTNGWHITQVTRQCIELFDAMSKTNGKLLCSR